MTATQDAQLALDTFGFLVIAYTHAEDALEESRRGFLKGSTLHNGRGYPLRAMVIGNATLADWRAQERLYGDAPAYCYRAYLKVIAE
jgi:hypothetical protein